MFFGPFAFLWPLVILLENLPDAIANPIKEAVMKVLTFFVGG